VRNGKLPRVGRALLADAAGTVVGTALGTSTVTAYVESAAGVSAGGRTGLANVVTAILLLAALFLYPLARLMGGGLPGPDGGTLYPVTAAALMSVGALMMRNVTGVRWDDPADAIPAFLTIVIMPLSLSIGDGLAFGFMSYAVLRALTGRAREVGWLVFLLAGLFALKLAFA
jgi:AGZA family xanthine/uracil permease-like MFS transporter